MLFQKNQTDILRKEIQALRIQNEKISQDLMEAKKVTVIQELTSQDTAIVNNTQPEHTTSSLCTDPATVSDIGRDVFPIDPKYKGITLLGQFFTAYNCGPTRVSNIFGVEGDIYTLGVTIWLKGQPSQSLIETYLSIGFNCYDANSGAPCKSELGTKKIILDAPIKIEELIKLEPYHEFFEADDCIDCG
ncbi:MAG TPA: hypothetical protein DEP63_05210 [Candidatus Magasanikbacteria bacterium]|nr:hypothetical protein [Candidatus Magasanikbacteria bacterium]HCC14110.1 hypothetical protein [Candidatus Magasanikbacteria bacterium]